MKNGFTKESISYVRNICTHYVRLYNAKLSKAPKICNQYREASIGSNRMFEVVLCMMQLLKEDKHWKLFVDRIELLIDKYEGIDIIIMGFPENWKELLLGNVEFK